MPITKMIKIENNRKREQEYNWKIKASIVPIVGVVGLVLIPTKRQSIEFVSMALFCTSL